MQRILVPLLCLSVCVLAPHLPVYGQGPGFSAPEFGSLITSLAVQPDGRILVGGWFTSVGGVSRMRVARLHAGGELDTSFQDPQVSNTVQSITLQPDGKIIIAGEFLQVNGQDRPRIARLNQNGTLDMTFNASLDGRVMSAGVQTDGKIVVGGRFTTVSGQARERLARLTDTGQLDPTFGNPQVQHSAGFVVPQVNVVRILENGDLIVGGEFDRVGGLTRSGVARLNTDGTVDAGFQDAAIGSGHEATYVTSIEVRSDGKIMVAGSFGSVGGLSRRTVARLEPDGSLDETFGDAAVISSSVTGLVRGMTAEPDGKVIIGGDFTIVGGGARGRLARLKSDGSLDTEFPDPSVLGGILAAVARQADGKILIGGEFTSAVGRRRIRIARLDPDGTLDVPLPKTFVVTKVADTDDGLCDADCSLREAISAANNSESDDTIAFESTVFGTPRTIVLTAGQLAICNAGSVTISGTGADRLTISGNNSGRIFRVFQGVTVAFDKMRLSGGNSSIGGFIGCHGGSDASFGGGAIENRGIVHISDSIISDNFSNGAGGGISNVYGDMTITNSVIRNNRANSYGGVSSIGPAGQTFGTMRLINSTVYNNEAYSELGNGGGGVGNADGSTMHIINSTIFANTSASVGGGLANLLGTIYVESSTVAGNSALSGGGVANAPALPQPKIYTRNSIIANNVAGAGQDVSGEVHSHGFNLIRSTSGAVIAGTTANNIYGADPLLDTTLAFNGGRTPTLAIFRGSPAIDSGSPDPAVVTDQRGKARPFDFTSVTNAPGSNASDIGAFELHEFATSIGGHLIPPSGELLRNSIVMLRNTKTREVRYRYVNSLGFFNFSQVLTGERYEIEVQNKSFKFPLVTVWIHGESDRLDLAGSRSPQ